MYTINFFSLLSFDATKTYYNQKRYIEKHLKFELELSNLYDVKSFFWSNFYKQISNHIDNEPYINGEKLNGIVITSYNAVVYKEILNFNYTNVLNGDMGFKIYTDKQNRTIYEVVSEEKGIKDNVLINEIDGVTK